MIIVLDLKDGKFIQIQEAAILKRLLLISKDTVGKS